MVTSMYWFYIMMAFWISGMIFALPAERREHFGWRLTACTAGLLGFSLLLFFLPWGNYVVKDAVFMVGGCILLCICIHGCWELSWSVSCYDTVWGVSVWQMNIEAITVLLLCRRTVLGRYKWELFLFLLYFVVSYFICSQTIAKWMPEGRKAQLGPRQMSLTILLFSVINMVSFHDWIGVGASLPTEWGYFFLLQLVCIVVLYLEGELFKKSQMKQEMEMLNFLYTTQKEQYRLSKENIALINHKCHDLKHQIRALRNANQEELDRYLGEIEDSIKIYEAIVKTGNDVFDTILTEKSLYCKDRQIQVSCVADAGQLLFMDPIDLYALLGNAMDNAIEAVEKFTETEKRQIDVMIYRKQNFMVVNILNPLAESLTYRDGLPVTTKKDSDFHGYGLRSMRQILKKYNGFLNVSEEDGCFSLKMLIPIGIR